MTKLKRWARRILPPVIRDVLRRCAGPLRWTGHYRDWPEAVRQCGGYDDPAILERVEAAARAVLAGRARYERDGVLFQDQEQRWPLLAAASLARQRCGHLRVVDIGGSLGSSWLQHRAWLQEMDADWRIVEQPAFVTRGRAVFAGLPLTFHTTLAEACADGPPALVVLSGVLPFLEDVSGMLTAVMAQKPALILIDHTCVHEADKDRIAIQRVSRAIYPAAYPCRIFARATIPRLIGPDYTLRADITNHYHQPGLSFAGWLFARRDDAGG